tara:strand:- start:249 stop:635 length:387 start_codon:yes stop_codon:yes gene_type:complete
MSVVFKSLTGNESDHVIKAGIGLGTATLASRLDINQLVVFSSNSLAITATALIVGTNRLTGITSVKFLAKDVIIPSGTSVNLICEPISATTNYSVIIRLGSVDDAAGVYLDYNTAEDNSFVQQFNIDN